MKYLHVTSEAHPETRRLLARQTQAYGTAEIGEVRSVNGHLLYVRNRLPILIPEPLPRELIAADFTPGR